MATTAKRTRLRIGAGSAGLTMTAREFDRIRWQDCDRTRRYQLIRGTLIVTPPPGNGEVDPNEELGYLLRLHRDSHPLGGVIDRTICEQTLPCGEDRRRCDRAIWVGLGRVPRPESDFPAIVVEFVSRSRRDYLRDYEEKRDEYRAAGAREYWIIDRFRRIMTVYRFAVAGGPAESVLVVPEAGTYETGLIPGFVLPVDRLLKIADDWQKPRRPRRARPDKPQAPEGDPR